MIVYQTGSLSEEKNRDTKAHKTSHCAAMCAQNNTPPFKRVCFVTWCERHVGHTKGSQIETFCAASSASEARLSAVRFA